MADKLKLSNTCLDKRERTLVCFNITSDKIGKNIKKIYFEKLNKNSLNIKGIIFLKHFT
jgi:hypothetical protein